MEIEEEMIIILVVVGFIIGFVFMIAIFPTPVSIGKLICEEKGLSFDDVEFDLVTTESFIVRCKEKEIINNTETKEKGFKVWT